MRYFQWLDALHQESKISSAEVDLLQAHFFKNETEVGPAVSLWISQHSKVLPKYAKELIALIPWLFLGRSQILLDEVTKIRQSIGAPSIFLAEILFLGALAEWRLKAPRNHWERVSCNAELMPFPLVLARCKIESAAAQMNLGYFQNAIAIVESALDNSYTWDDWLATRAHTILFSCNLYSGNFNLARFFLKKLKPKNQLYKKSSTVTLATLRRALSFAQESEDTALALKLIKKMQSHISESGISRLLIAKETLRLGIKQESIKKIPHQLAYLRQLENLIGKQSMKIHIDLETIEALILENKWIEAYEHAVPYYEATLENENTIQKAESLVLLGECLFLIHKFAESESFLSEAFQFCSRMEFQGLKERTQLLLTLCGLAQNKHPKFSLQETLKSVVDRKLSVTEARILILNSRLGFSTQPQKDIMQAWRILLKNGSKCLRIDTALRIIAVRTSKFCQGPALLPLACTGQGNEPELVGQDSNVLDVLAAQDCALWFGDPSCFLFVRSSELKVNLVSLKKNSVFALVVSAFFKAQKRGLTVEELHFLRMSQIGSNLGAKIEFREHLHGQTIRTLLSRLRSELGKLGLHVNYDPDSKTYQLSASFVTYAYGTRDLPIEGLEKKNHNTSRTSEILRFLQSKSILTAKELMTHLGITRQSLRIHMNKLVAEGTVITWGKGPGVRYRLSQLHALDVFPSSKKHRDLES